MITKLHLENFKCFSSHTVKLEPTSIIIGLNNEGKSTVVEALRLLSVTIERSRSLPFRPPNDMEVPVHRVVAPSLRGIDVNLVNVFFNYGSGPALISAEFDTGYIAEVYITTSQRIFGAFKTPEGRMLSSRSSRLKASIPRIGILPQVAPLLFHERILSRAHVSRSLDTSISYQHFRNQLRFFPDYYDRFTKLVEETWPGLIVVELEEYTGEDGNELSLLIRDTDFTAEISWMGHGVQMWLQTMWFVARSWEQQVVVLDEPDVYLHADLQHKLIRLLRDRYLQLIVITHSAEIVSEVSPDEIVVLSRRRKLSQSASSLDSVQKVLDMLGTAHNLQLARLWHHRKLLLVEGDDIELIKIFDEHLNGYQVDSLITIPQHGIGGWDGWNYVMGASLTLKNAASQKINVICILDSDYHTREEIDQRKTDAVSKGIILHVWNRKEIENYVLIPSAISRFVSERSKSVVKSSDIDAIITESIIASRDKLISGYIDSFSRMNRKWTPARAYAEAKRIVDDILSVKAKQYKRCPGKHIMGQVSAKCKERFGVSFSVSAIARTLVRKEINAEVRRVILLIRK